MDASWCMIKQLSQKSLYFPLRQFNLVDIIKGLHNILEFYFLNMLKPIYLQTQYDFIAHLSKPLEKFDILYS